MRNERKRKIMTLSILVGAVLLISVGFAAFSSTLKIKSQATLNPDASLFDVKLSTANSIPATMGTVAPTLYPSSETTSLSNNITASSITIEGSTTIAGMSAAFVSPGDEVSYTLYVVNEGAYNAYLTSINFLENKVCTALEDTQDTLVQEACNGISATLSVAGIPYTETTQIQNHKLNKQTGELIQITLKYDSNATRADGPFTVNFGKISLVYSTITEMNQKYTGSIYRNSTESLYIGGDINTVVYETTPLNINKTYYLKHDVVDDIVTASYACITYTENGTRKDVCLRGVDPTYYASNQTILRSIESYFNTLPNGSGKGYCDFGETLSLCNSDSLDLSAYSDGIVYAIGDSSGCYVTSVSHSYCY